MRFRNAITCLFFAAIVLPATGKLLHRYDFSGTGTVCYDLAGSQDATILGGAKLSGDGQLALDGSNDYVSLPGGILGQLNSTLEAWVTWEDTATREWQNIFFFGNGGNHWMFLTPQSQGAARFAIAMGSAEIRANAASPMPVNSAAPLHLAVVIDGTDNTAKFYLDGNLECQATNIPALSGFDDSTNSLGKPIFNGFPTFRGTFHEFRVHDTAFSQEKVYVSKARGMDNPLGPEIQKFTASSQTVRTGSSVTFEWEVSEGAKVSISPDVLQDGNLTGSVDVVVSQPTTYTLRAEDGDGVRTQKLVVEIDDRPEIHSFAADVTGITKIGDLATLSWDTAFADHLEISPNVEAIVGSNGSVQVPLLATTEFTLLARNAHGEVSVTLPVRLPETGLLKITEFLADNHEGLLDSHGEESDWIEIHNIGNDPVDLSRWSLADDPDNLAKWTFPAGRSLDPGRRLVVFASGRGEPGSNGELHTNFKLTNNSGGYLSLVRDDGVVGSVYAGLPKQEENRSTGILEEGNLPTGGRKGDVAVFVSPTPGLPNLDGFLGQVKDTAFSHDRGFYTKAFDLAIDSKTPGAEIYYTLDGTDPSPSNGTLYDTPLRIRKTTTIRVAAFLPGLLPTDIDTQSYIFLYDVIRQSPYGTPPAGWPTTNVNNQYISYGMDPDIVFSHNTAAETVEALESIPTLSIVIDLDHLFDSQTGIYTHAQNDGIDWEREASMELLNPDGTKGFQSGVGLRIRGGASRNSANPKHSFRVFFRREYGNPNLRYPLFGDEGTDKFDKFDLRTSQSFSWARKATGSNTLLRDIFLRDTQGAMGQPYTRSRYYHLYLNGMYWGIFMTQERVGTDYCVNYYGGAEEDYDVVKQTARVMRASAGKVDDYFLFHKQAVAGFETDAAYYKAQGLEPDGVTPNPEYRKYLNVDNLADFMVITYWAANRDGPGSKYTRPRPNNYYALFNRTNPDGFKHFLHDNEASLGLPENDMVNPLLSSDSRTFIEDSFNAHWLHERLTAHPEYVMAFADRFYKHCFNDGVLTVENALARLDFRAQQIDKAIIAESARWGDQSIHPPKNQDDWLAAVEFIRTWIRDRRPVVISQLRGQNWYPETEPPAITLTDDELTFTGITGKAYYTLDGSDPRLSGGTTNPSATEYTAAFTIPHTRTTLKIRTLNGNEWSPLHENTYTLGAKPAAPGTLAISEIHYNPPAPTASELASDPLLGDSDFEFIELLNIGTEDISLDGAEFKDGVTLVLPDHVLLPGARALVVNNLAAFRLRYGDTPVVVGEFIGNLKNDGEQILLVDMDGNTIARIDYNDGGSWPGRADGKGSSLEAIDPAASPEDPANWRNSSEFGGTPGTNGAGPDNRIVINEVLTHTDPPLQDTIELLNTTSQTLDISGWLLSDTASDLAKYTFPANTTLAPGAYLLIDETQFNSDPENPDSNGFALSSGKGDSVWLVEANPEGKPLRFVDHIEFPAARNGESFGRFPNATGKPYPSSQTTLGAENALPRVGPLVVSEIHYNPASGDPVHQFIEIANTSSEYTPLANWKLRGSVDFDFPGWVILPPSSLLLLLDFDPADATKLDNFRATYPSLPERLLLLGPWTNGSLKTSGHNIRLLRPDELQSLPGETPFFPMLTEEEFEYDSTAPWPTSPLDSNHSIHRKSLTIRGFEPTHWEGLSPTPGQYGDLEGDDKDADGMSDLWENQYFGQTTESATADFDHDNLPNLLEFALGTNPSDSQSNTPLLATLDTDSHLTLTYRQLNNSPSLRYEVQIYDPTSGWIPADNLTEVLSTQDEGQYTLLTIRDKSPVYANPSRFLRILVTSE
jgi:hypothetical protein